MNPSYDDRIARLERDILPLALPAVGELAARGERCLAGDGEALRLLRLNFERKARLMTLGAIYALEVPPELLQPLVGTFVRWGALFTLIDTAIDEGGISDRGRCDRLAAWLEIGADARAISLPVEPFLADLAAEIDAGLRRLSGYPALIAAIRPRLRKHAQLVTYQHLAATERSGYLTEIGADGYAELCADGSPGAVFEMVRAAACRGASLRAEDLLLIERLYLPEFGVLHVLADDLADLHEDAGAKDLNLARAARDAGCDPGAELVSRVAAYLRRLPAKSAVLFPLRLILSEYQRAAAREERGAFEDALHMLRAAEEAP